MTARHSTYIKVLISTTYVRIEREQVTVMCCEERSWSHINTKTMENKRRHAAGAMGENKLRRTKQMEKRKLDRGGKMGYNFRFYRHRVFPTRTHRGSHPYITT